MERSRLRYLLAGLTAVFIGILSQLSPLLRAYPIDVIANVINAVLIAYAIFRYQLLSVTLVIRKGLLYSIPTIALSIAYFLTISLAINLLHVSLGGQVFLLSMLLAIAAALVAEPARNRLQGAVDRLFFRESYNTDAMLQRLSRTAATILDLDRLAQMILDDIQKTMHIRNGSFLIKQTPAGDYMVRAQTGLHYKLEDHWKLSKDHPIVAWLIREQASLAAHEVDMNPEFKVLWTREREELSALNVALFVPLLIRNDLIGILCLGPKLSELPYADNEQLMLSTLANQTAVAIENASLFSETVAEKKRTSTIIEQAFAGIILLDSKLRITGLNPAAEAIIGLPAAQIVGQRLSDILGPGIAGDGSSLRQAMLTGQRVPPREETLACSDRPHDVLLGVAPLKDGFLLSLADITQIKEADRFKSDIVANVSHEFRTPLAIIKAYAELLMDEACADDVASRREFLSVIDSETTRLTGMVSDLLDLARLEARPRLGGDGAHRHCRSRGRGDCRGALPSKRTRSHPQHRNGGWPAHREGQQAAAQHYAAQSGRQCDQVQPTRRYGRSICRACRQLSSAQGHRSRHRHLGGRSTALVREILPLIDRPGGRHPRHGHRPGAGQASRRSASRHHRREESARLRHLLHRHPSGQRREPGGRRPHRRALAAT